jgi:glycerol-3-phosphate cytidylyltransferase
MIFNKIQELKREGKKIGITFSTFDLLHAGHIAMLAEAKNHCDYLIAALQTDPTIDRPDTKNPPVQSIVERQIQLSTNRNVDEVVVYQTEKDLEDLLLILPVDVRILGVEYADKEFTGKKICADRGITCIFNKRDHSFSSSSLRKRVALAQSVTSLPAVPPDGLPCRCYKCLEQQIDPNTLLPLTMNTFIVCPDCGNKRCPRATDHTLACTNSNEPGQQGSRYQ